MRKYMLTNLSEKVKNIVFYPPIKHLANWESKTIKEKQYFVLDIGRGFTKKFKVEALSNDSITVKSIFSIWDLAMLFIITIFACMFPISIIFQFGIGSSIVFGVSFVLLLTNYALFYPYCWRTIRNSIRKLY